MLIDPLRIFVTVVEEKSFSRAADELYLSQPGVSLHIRNLENEFGAKLINRSSKHVELTQAGEILYRNAYNILNQYNQVVEEINLLRNVVSGTLKIGASFTIGEYILPKVLAQTAKKYPSIDIVVTIANTDEISQALHHNHLDIGIVEGQVNLSDLSMEPFMEDEMVLIVPNEHQLREKTAAKIDDLQDLIWILRENGSGTRAFSDHLIKNLGLTVKKTYVFSSHQGVKEAVICGLGIAVVSRLIVQSELSSGKLGSVKIESKKINLSRKFLILRQKDFFPSKTLEVFLEELNTVAETADNPGGERDAD